MIHKIIPINFEEKEFSEDKFVKGGDLIRFYNSHYDVYLTADKCYTGVSQKPEVYGRKYTGQYAQEKSSLDSLWEIETDSVQERGNVCKLKGKQGRKAQTYRLRHFRTRKLLTIQMQYVKELDSQQKIALLGDHIDA